MIILNQLSMAHGSKVLFTDVNLKLIKNNYALVGANGTGKSTLLKIIMGEDTPTDGSISIPRQATIGWLKQDQFKYENTKILDVVIQGKAELWQALSEKEQILNSLETEEYTDEIGYKLAELEETIAHNDGYTADITASNMLLGLGVEDKYHKKNLSSLSGGYKLRVLLAQTLFANPDILLLDEPTNHLDILSIAWLEKYLRTKFNGLLVFISHDVEFINKLADKILDVDYGEIRSYSSPYNKFLSEKQEVEQQKLHELKHAEDKIANLQLFVDKFRAKASKAKQAQSKLKQMEKIELPDIKKSSRMAPKFLFNMNKPSAKKVLEVNNISKSYGDKNIFNNVSFNINKGEKVVIIGANGIGKSTLIKSLLKEINIDHGEFEWGVNTSISYFSQDHHDLLNKSQTVYNWLCEYAEATGTQDVRKMLGRVLFTKDEVEKDVLAISGGEAARLLLARVMLEHANVLVLDEPTNHMDLESIETLSKALEDYSGTLLLVSHNRDLIKHVATRIIYVTKNKVIDFKGKYNDFLQEYEI